jgi:predicted HTH transcriptional regulator
MKIMEWIVREGKITNRNIQRMFGISNTSAKREIDKLREIEVIKLKGECKNVHHVIICR